MIAIVTLFGLLATDHSLFLAGRLDSPIGYRNATAALFAFGAWPLLGYAARRGLPTMVRAAAFSAASLSLSLAFLTQSRGVVIGLVLGGVVSLAIGPDRLRRAWLAIAAVAAVAVFSSGLLAPYDAFIDHNGFGHRRKTSARAATAAAFITLATFFLGIFVVVFDNGLRSSSLDRTMRIAAGVGLVLVVVAGAGVAVAKVGNPVDYAETKLDEFNETEPAATTGSTRLGSVGGQRSDLWRVAWDEFEDAPVAGAGAGSYQFAYYRDRHTDRNLSDTHSLPLRLLADTGLVGFLLFLTWLIAAGAAVARSARRASNGDKILIAGLAAAGTTVLAQCLIDWLWLLPGLLGLTFFALGLAANGAGERTEAAPQPDDAVTGPLRIAAAALCGIALLSVTFLFLSDLYVRKARVETAPAARLSAAETAAWFNPVAVTPLYLEASALEGQEDRVGAREKLEDAVELEPDNFVPYGLSGDFEVRGNNGPKSQQYYRQALERNPLDTGLQELAEGKPR